MTTSAHNPQSGQRAAADDRPLLQQLRELTQWHYERCQPYRRMVDVMQPHSRHAQTLAELPFLPVRLFKLMELRSVPESEISKVLASSGTSAQVPSRIFLDKETAIAQTRALVEIVQSFIGTKRLPMAVVDSPTVLRDPRSFSARGAAVLGFSQFGADREFLLKETMELDVDALRRLEAKASRGPVLLFGFTGMVWKHLFEPLHARGERLRLQNATLIHGGGWKKLLDERVSNDGFKVCLKEQLGLERVHDYYGMVEQTGSIFMECEQGFLHCSRYSDVLARDAVTFAPQNFGSPGILQTFSNLPKSYPGHSLLTEDVGVVFGEDDCKCGRSGKYFHVHGRLANAELRGCSDTRTHG